ncbi:unnamed protein product [marine sediment metagenome]|uniref:Uncharacterized protein n=1 Tax=marine sediment metagenome TaxID=412755 RepID=X1LUX0_9ZZZZ
MGPWWFIFLQPYYKEQDLLLCPMATKPYQEGGWAPFAAWRTSEGDSGSYGANGYIINTPPGMDFQLGRPTEGNWRTTDVKGAANIPVLLDALWVNGWPEHYDQPAEFEDWWMDEIGANEMRRFCANRHNGCVNGVFVDFSIRKIELKQLWRLKWSRGYNVNADPPIWPDWMRKFKDY